jgi:hypothetical protein
MRGYLPGCRWKHILYGRGLKKRKPKKKECEE